MGTAYAHLAAELLDVEHRIVDVGVDDGHDFFHKSLVVALHLGSGNLIVIVLHAREFAFELQAVVDDIVNHHIELVNVKRFADVSVGSAVPSGHTVGDVALGAQQDNGHMVGAGVGFELLEQCQTVHLWHHHIAHHEVGHIVENHFHGLGSVGCCRYTIDTREMVFDVFTQFGIVVHHEYAAVGRRVAHLAARGGRGCVAVGDVGAGDVFVVVVGLGV